MVCGSQRRSGMLRSSAVLFALVFAVTLSFAESITVTGRTRLERDGKIDAKADASNVVVWLSPLGSTLSLDPTSDRWPAHPRLTQRNKRFEPHVLIVPVGTSVEFPNHDPFFHNVFSLFDGKRFDLGLYEAGTTRDVRFDKPGVSYIFCNIHPEMSAVVIALDTPYYGISDLRGQVVIANVPSGKYTLRVWYESALPETLKAMTREVAVSEGSSTLGVLRVAEANLPTAHKNLYGRDYDSPAP